MVNSVNIERLLVFCFLFVFAVIPISFLYLAPLLATLGLASLLYAFVALLNGVPRSAFYTKEVALSFIACGLVFIVYSIAVTTNDSSLIYKDSVGFVFYPFYFTLAALAAKGEIDGNLYKNFVVVMGVFVVLLHIVGFFAFYIFLGEVSFETIETTNALLSGWGSAAKFGGAHWLVRVDFGMSALLIMPTLMCFDNLVKGRYDSWNWILLAVFGFSIFLEGHRALAIAVFIGCMLLMLRFRGVRRVNVFLLICVLVSGPLALFLTNSDDGSEGLFSRFSELVTTMGLDDYRKEQFPSLLAKIELHPTLGSGFGSHADVIRNEERPYMYELDYLAVVMKLGLLGSIWYFSTFLYLLYLCLKSSRWGGGGYIYFYSGVSFFLYSGTNGGFAMSIVSSLMHLLLMLGVTVEYNSRVVLRYPSLRRS